MIENYRRLIELTRPEVVGYPEQEAVLANRRIIRHEADVPVLLSAIEAKPDWLPTHNTRHFTPTVAENIGLRIARPLEFFETLAALLKRVWAGSLHGSWHRDRFRCGRVRIGVGLV